MPKGALRIAIAQINPTVGDLRSNTSLILKHITQARSAGANIVAFPELAVTGYPPEDLLLKPHFVKENIEACNEIAASTQNITAVYGFIEMDTHLYNSAAIAHDGKIIATHRKYHLPNYGVFDEQRYFNPGTSCNVFTINGVKVGINICEDIWYPQEPISLQCAAGAAVIVNLNGSPFHIGKLKARENMLAARSSENKVHIVYVNLVGGQDELVFDGASVVFTSTGKILTRANQFEEELLIFDLDCDTKIELSNKEPAQSKYSREQEPEWSIAENIHVSNYSPNELPSIQTRKRPHYSGVEEVYRSLVLGTRDYVQKCGFNSVLVALSGGIDSSLVAAIAVDALGPGNVIGLSMPSAYSSKGSTTDTEGLAENLHIRLETIPIQGIFDAMRDALTLQFKGTVSDTTEENMQSRIRGDLVMSMSNKFGWLVLTTGNKSEMAVGYATIYGDMAGGFAVIKDVPKVMVYDLCKHINFRAGTEIIPQSVIEKPPSAELKPDQKDSDTLPSYDILDPILEQYIERDKSYREIKDMGFDPEIVKQIINLVDKSEYKRRQSPPGVKITPKNFGRDRRMPISNRYKPF